MIRQTPERIAARARALLTTVPNLKADLIQGESVIGGGATPEQSIPTWLIAVDCLDVVETERQLRSGETPVVARVADGRLILDLRTVFPEDEAALAAALRAIA